MLAEADQIRTVQADLIALADTDLDTLMAQVAKMTPEAGRDLLIQTLPDLARVYGDVGSAAAAEWFEQLRVQHVGSTYPPRLASPVGAQQIEQTVRFAAKHLFEGDPAGMTAYLRGALAKWISEPTRMTIIESVDADPIGYGWQRVVRPGGCKFCQMLADRGGVYTRKSVWFAAHNNCNCGVVPSWDPSLPEVDVMAYVASERMESVRIRASSTATDPKGIRDRKRAQQILEDHAERIRAWVDN